MISYCISKTTILGDLTLPQINQDVIFFENGTGSGPPMFGKNRVVLMYHEMGNPNRKGKQLQRHTRTLREVTD